MIPKEEYKETLVTIIIHYFIVILQNSWELNNLVVGGENSSNKKYIELEV